MYGQFDNARTPKLAPFYERCGFTLAPPGEGVDLQEVTGRPGGPAPEAGETMFSCHLRKRGPRN